jgi:hypothetical protein
MQDMNLDLTEEESAALVRELDRIINDDRYFLSPRIQTPTMIRNKIKPPAPAIAALLPAPKAGDGPRAAFLAQKRRRRG